MSDPEEVRTKIKDHLVRQIDLEERSKVIDGVYQSGVRATKMLSGLKNVIEALEEIIQGEHSKPVDLEMETLEIGKTIRHLREDHNMPPEQAEQVRRRLNRSVERHAENAKLVRTLSKSVRALAQTQTGLAAGQRDMANVLMAYLFGETYPNDLASSAAKFGAGREALQALYKAKVGG